MTQDEIEARGEFTPRTQGEIDRNLFAARTGALVTLSAGATWELLHAAQAWHRHVKAGNSLSGLLADKNYSLEPRFNSPELTEAEWKVAAAEAATPLSQQAAWQPSFDAHSVEQERLAREFCFEIAGPRGKPGSAPDPVRLLEMAQALYEAERAVSSPLAPQARDTTPSEDA